ncbi:hypothetical protein HPB49_010249 [Dermacentor silvarum]|uniref:Uncharacterized protein n=1 Tax=Dermacentor silvarum TaxID=543639 RepID=A0ACB8DZ18_DERSI|nr:hypothetical protein HPB49_010249 [Dermacentor silvarum]
MGITDSGQPPSTEPIARFRGTIRKKNTRYTVALPWKEDQKQLLGSNHDTALTCLQKLAKSLSMNEGLLERYDAVIRQYLELGHAEVVPKNVPIDRATYYMPCRSWWREPEWLSQPRSTCPTDSDMSTPIYEE